MIRKFILLLTIGLIPILASSQSMSKKLAKQLCKCLEKNEITRNEDMDPCYEQMILKNIDNLYKHYNVKSLDDIDFEKIGNEIAAEFSKECDYMIPYLTDPINKMEKDFVPEENLDCSQLKKGEFYYLQSSRETMVSDTIFVSIKDDMFMERMKNGRTYSFLEIVWITECRFDLIFKDSNDPFKSALSKKGDKYEYEIIERTQTSFTIRTKWKNQNYKFELYLID